MGIFAWVLLLIAAICANAFFAAAAYVIYEVDRSRWKLAILPLIVSSLLWGATILNAPF